MKNSIVQKNVTKKSALLNPVPVLIWAVLGLGVLLLTAIAVIQGGVFNTESKAYYNGGSYRYSNTAYRYWAPSPVPFRYYNSGYRYGSRSVR